MLTIEARDPSRKLCECCGGTTTTLVRFVYLNGDAHGIYYARYSDNHPTASVALLVAIGDFGDGSSEADRVAWSMDLWPGNVRVTDAAECPWRDAKTIGKIMDREEGLAHPRLKEAFNIVDKAVLDDEPLRDFLARAETAKLN